MFLEIACVSVSAVERNGSGVASVVQMGVLCGMEWKEWTRIVLCVEGPGGVAEQLSVEV